MSLTVVAALLLVAGCYTDVRTGASAPVGHGHGDAGADLDVALGAEHVDDTLRVGGGMVVGARLAEANGYVPIGIDGHMATQLTPYVQGKAFNWLAVAHVSVGYGEGMATTSKLMAPTPPNGVFNEAFVGIGLGATKEHPDSRVPRGHIAIGPQARWFRSDAGNSYWFLGASLELSFGFLLRSPS